MDRLSVHLFIDVIGLRGVWRLVRVMNIRPIGDTLSQTIINLAALIGRADDAFAGIDVASTIEADVTSQTLDIRTGVGLATGVQAYFIRATDVAIAIDGFAETVDARFPVGAADVGA